MILTPTPHRTAPQWLILSAWAAFGVVLTLIGHYRPHTSMKASELATA